MKWYTKWYVTYPLVWGIVIILTIWVFPPVEYYQFGSVLGRRLFVITLCFAAFNYGSKKINQGEKKIIKRYASADLINREELPKDVKLEKDDNGWYAYIYEKK